MKEKGKINVLGFPVSIKQVKQDDYISLTDIAQSNEGRRAPDLIRDWLKNQKTLLFLETWETVHNPDFKVAQMRDFRLEATSERFNVSPKKYIETTNAIGLISKSGRYGAGTYGHIELALAFAYWLEPSFQVYFLQEFNRMKEVENQKLENTKRWVLEKALRDADSIRDIAQLGLQLHDKKNLLEEE